MNYSLDAEQLNKLTVPLARVFTAMGVEPDTVGWHRLMTSAIEMNDQSPELMKRFLNRLPDVVAEGMTMEGIAKARADSFQHPETGQWEYNKDVFKTYTDLLAHQRLETTAFDYGGKL